MYFLRIVGGFLRFWSGVCKMQGWRRTFCNRRIYGRCSMRTSLLGRIRWWGGFIGCCAMPSWINTDAGLRKTRQWMCGVTSWRGRLVCARRIKGLSAGALRRLWRRCGRSMRRCCVRWNWASNGCRITRWSAGSLRPMPESGRIVRGQRSSGSWFASAIFAVSMLVWIVTAGTATLEE